MESEAAVPAGGGAAEHVDKGLLTIIAEDAAQGLQVAIAHDFEFDAFLVPQDCTMPITGLNCSFPFACELAQCARRSMADCAPEAKSGGGAGWPHAAARHCRRSPGGRPQSDALHPSFEC